MKNSNKLFNKPLRKLRTSNFENLKINEKESSVSASNEKESSLKEINDLYREKKYNKVIEKINIFLKTYPYDFNAKNVLALSYKYIGNLDKSIKLLQSLIDEFPKEGFLSANLGNIFYGQGKVMLAIEQYKRCIQIEPSLANAYTGLSNCYNELGQPMNAIPILEKVLITEPKNDSANYNLGNIYRNLGEHEKAIPYYQNTDIFLSKSHQLECFYLTGDKNNFLKNLKSFKENKIFNPLIACLSSHSSIVYTHKNDYGFCDEPFDYIFSKNLIENKLLDENFIEEVKSSLKKLNLDFKKQDLLKKGSQSSGNIFMTEDRVISKLKNIILKEIENYKETFKNSSDEYIKSWPKKFQLHGWVVNISKGGSLRPHIHKEGWMSGSLYFEIPKKILPDDGNIAFSLTGANYPTSGIDFEERMVETLKGEIVLFPSSIFHHTIAFESDEERMTIAFDVIPI